MALMRTGNILDVSEKQKGAAIGFFFNVPGDNPNNRSHASSETG